MPKYVTFILFLTLVSCGEHETSTTKDIGPEVEPHMQLFKATVEFTLADTLKAKLNLLKLAKGLPLSERDLVLYHAQGLNSHGYVLSQQWQLMMGDVFEEDDPDATPVHRAIVAPFELSKYEFSLPSCSTCLLLLLR